jgi:hypothetical protein
MAMSITQKQGSEDEEPNVKEVIDSIYKKLNQSIEMGYQEVAR